MKDLKNNVGGAVAVNPQALSGTGTLTGNIIDRKNYESVTFAIIADAISASSLAITPVLYEGDDSGLSDAAAVADADLLGTEAQAAIANTDDKPVKRLGYVGTKRYLRLDLVVDPNDGTDVVAALAILGHPELRPVDQG